MAPVEKRHGRQARSQVPLFDSDVAFSVTMPTSSLINALQQELAALESDLEADPRSRQIKRIRALLDEYATATITAIPPPPTALRHNGAQRPETKRTRVHDVIHRILSSTGKTHRRELLTILQDTGLLVEDKDPMTTLAIYLTDFKDFRSAGAGYWELVPTETHEAPTAKAMEASKSSDSGSEALFRETADHDR